MTTGKRDIIGVGGLITAIIAGIYIPVALNNNWFPFKAKSEVKQEEVTLLSLQDLIIIDSGGNYPILDIKVLNEGDQTIFITKAIISIEKIWKIKPKSHIVFFALPSSFDYNVDLDLNKELPSIMKVNLSQVIKKESPDRFTIALKHNASGEMDYVIKISMTLNYNQDKHLDVEKIILLASKPGSQGSYFSPVDRSVLATLTEIQKIEGRKSDNLEGLLSRLLSP